MQRVIKLSLFILSALMMFSLMTPALQSVKAAGDTDPAVIASSKDAIVQTESGKVRGYIHTGTFTFKGIPYAQAERFMPPQKPKPWEGVRSSMSFGYIAPQGTGGPADATAAQANISDEYAFFIQSVPQTEGEDCQRLNIWSPGINDNVKRPVMVWLHGGGFSTGSGHGWTAFDGESLSKKGSIVVVTLNHRLNVLGFLDLSAFGSKYKSSGNVGIMDIIAALNWIKSNISGFGGDPGNVTIFGQSGGGGKVSTLMATPSAKGLFQKAIVQSGSTLKVSESEISRKAGIEIMAQLGLKPYQVDELQKIPYEDLYKAGEKAWSRIREEMKAGQGFAALRFGWSPTVDGDFLPAHPFDPAAPEISKDIPLMVGSTLNEMVPSEGNASLRNATQAQAEEYLKKTYGERTAAFIDEFGKAYPGYKPVDLIDTDVSLRSRAVQQAKLKSAQNGAPVYMYLFAWQTPILDGVHKAFHCSEIPFVFNNVALTEHITTGSKEAHALADRVSQAWINFAKTGNPNHAGLPSWPAFTDKKQSTMVFDDKCVVKENYDMTLMEIVSGN
jgi:para-nitrobenzyl esterase